MVSSWSSVIVVGSASALAASLLFHRQNKRTIAWPLILGAGGYLLLNALGRVKVGLKRRQLGRSVPGLDKARRLGLLERWYVAHSRAGTHTGFVLCMELEAAAVPSRGKLQTILQNVSKKFSWLRYKVRRDGVDGVDSRITVATKKSTSEHAASEPVWGDDLYVEEVVDLCQPLTRTVVLEEPYSSPSVKGGLHRVLEEESLKQWRDEDPSKPMWRVTLVTWKDCSSKFALVLAFHHLITDGMGALQVARAILNASSGNLTLLGEVNQELPSPMEDVMDTVPRLSHVLLPVLLDRIPRLAAVFMPPHWRGSAVHRDCKKCCERSTELVCFSLLKGGTEMTAVRDYCSKHKLTFYSVVAAALLKSMTKVVAKNGLVRLKIQVAVDERRRRAKVPANQLGDYLTGPTFYLTVGEVDCVESLGQSFARKLRASLETAAMDVGLLPFIKEDWIDFSRTLCNEKPNGVHESLHLSLLSGIDDLDHSEWKVYNLWFAQGRRGFGPAIGVSVAGTVAGLNATMAAFPEAVSKDMLDSIAHAWKHELCAVVQAVIS
jgi:Alcohol acetyltransferase